MNQKICKTVLEQRERFVPTIFTAKQVEILKRYLQHEKLSNSEKATLYSTIKMKIDALQTLQEEFHVQGAEMIPGRVELAKKILRDLNQEKAFISGSFLYKKKYRDIDVFVLAARRKSYHHEGKHFIFVTEKMLQNPIFISSLHYSVANFPPPTVKPSFKRPPFEHINMTYQMAINEILNKEEERTLREIVFMYYVYIKQVILSSYSLYCKAEEIIKKKKTEKIKEINLMAKALILQLYSKRYMYQHLSEFVKQLKEDFSKEPYENFPIFINLFLEVKNECRRA